MASAERQIAAIEISERTEAEKQQPTSSAVHVDTIMNPKKRKPKYSPSILLKGDYVGHPFRGNQWTDASGVSRGLASGSASDGDRVDLRGVATVEEARRTGRPLALLQPETYPAGVQAVLRARFDAAEIVKNLLEGVPPEEQGAIANDPRFIVAEYASKLAYYEVFKQIGRDYALALGFTEVTGEEAEKARSEKYTYDHVSRNEDGRLTHSEETVYPTEMTGEQSAMNVRGSIVWRDGSGKLHFWFIGEEQPPEFTEIYGQRSSTDGIDLRALADPSRISPESFYHRDTDEEGVQRGPKAVAFANQEMQKRIRALGIRMPDIQPFANLSGKALEEKLRADGDPDPKATIGRLIDHVNSVANKVALSHAPMDGSKKFRGQNIDGSEDFQMAQQMEDITPDAKISVTVPANKVSAILKDGRLKTQFETQRSGGANMPTWREDWEAVMFGYPIGSNPSVRPIYGMVETGGVQPSSLRGNEQYGTVTLVLKDSVRDRTTFTNGDSLNLNPFYAPVNNPSFRPTSQVSQVSLSRREEILQRRAEDPLNRGYYEAQIHGGVSVSDIERVVIDTSTYKDYEQREVQPSAALIKALTKAGIPFEIVQGKPPTVPKVDKALFNPSVLIKGDYVGHPFRGNQWTDASGISRGVAGSSADQDRQAYEMRQAGETWEAIAQHLGYANGGAVRRLALRHEARLRASGETPPKLTPQPAVGTPEGGATATPTGQFFNGLRTPSADLLTAAREGRPLQGWLAPPPEIKALIQERDELLMQRNALELEARDIVARYLESLSPEERQEKENQALELRSATAQRLVEWVSRRDPAFAARYESSQLPEKYNYYALEQPLIEHLLVQAGFRYRTESEQAQLAKDLKSYYNEYGPEEEAARRARLNADPHQLRYTQYDRDKMGGRLKAETRVDGVDTSAVQQSLFGRVSFGPLLAQGLSQQEIGEIVMAARKVASSMLFTDILKGSRLDQSVSSVQQLQMRAIKTIEEQVKTARVSVTVPPRILSQILNEGRFKTQFETGKSGGYNLPQARQGEESARFGYPPNLDPSLRPIYGMVETEGIKLPHDRGNLQYGSALVILKPEVRERTTFTKGDSLGNTSPSAPLTNPRAEPRVAGTYFEDKSFSLDYAEAQIHGGVKVSDIERVVFQVDSTRSGGSDIAPDPKLVPAPSPSLLKALDKAGIPYQIVGLTSEITQPVTKHRKWLFAFDPSVVIKGDYEGHPFRGNQWVDASGVSTKPAGTASDHQGGFAAGKKYERQRGPFRADPISREPLRDVSSPTGEYDARSAGDMGRQYETSSKPDSASRIVSDKKARTIASDLMDKMDRVADANATIKIGSPSREVRAVYNDQLDTLAETELETRNSQRLLDGINATQEALNDEGVVVVITDSEDRIVGALSFDDETTDSSSFRTRSSFHPMSEVVKPNEKYIQMRSAGSLGRIDGVGSTLFGQAVLAASRQGAGLYLTPLNKSALEFWENVGFKTVDAGQEFATYQYIDADSVRAIAENIDDPMEQQ